MLRRIRCIAIVAWAVILFTGSSAIAFAQEESPAVVSYRPSVATPADLPAPGWPQLEAAWNGAKGGDLARSQSVPIAFRLAWSETWGVVVGTDAYDWQRDFDGNTAHSGGDTTLQLKYRLPVNDSLSLGAQFGAGLPTARPPIGTGKTDWGGVAIASFDSELAHVDVNLIGTRLGAVDEGLGQWQGAWAIAASRPLPQGFIITGEVSGIVQRGTSAQAQALAGLDYNVSRQIILDVAVTAGLSRAAPDWQITAGITVQLGHWF
jgi:hypothetical protein